MNNITFTPIKLDSPLRPGNYNDSDLFKILLKNHKLRDGDILAITSKIISIIEGRVFHQDSSQWTSPRDVDTFLGSVDS